MDVNRTAVIMAVVIVVGLIAAVAISNPQLTPVIVSSGPLDSPDTDGDGLTDFQEVRIYKTNPLDPNTDHDRYTDGQEIYRGFDPLVVNSARVETIVGEDKGEYNGDNVAKDTMIIILMRSGVGGCTGGTIGACAEGGFSPVAKTLDPILDDVLYTASVEVQFSNVGDDYTSFIRYTASYYVGGKKVKQVPGDVGPLEVGETKGITLTDDIKLRDVPARI